MWGRGRRRHSGLKWEAKGPNLLTYSVSNSQHFSLAFPLHHIPKEKFVMVSGPSAWSLSVSVTEILGYGLISLLLTPFFEAKSWKPGSLPSSLLSKCRSAERCGAMAGPAHRHLAPQHGSCS